MSELKGWKDIPIGGVILEPGNSTEYETGSWRTFRPIWDQEKCIHCLRCWSYCPDGSIMIEDGKVVGIDYEHCKGCGICSTECPVKGEKAITMKLESDCRDQE